MKKIKVLSLCLAMIMTASMFVGCKKEDQPADSEGDYVVDHSGLLDEKGYMKDIKALDFVELGDYKNIVVPKSELVADPKEVQTQIDSIIDYFSTYEQVKEGEVKEDSTLNIDYVGTIDGVAFEGGSTNGQGTDVTIGVTQYIEGFLSQLVGHKVGETFDINVVFPSDYTTTELAGKPAVFKITINSLQGEKIVPELTDEFVKENISSLMEAETVAEFKGIIESDIVKSQKNEYVWKKFLETATVKEIPQKVIDFQSAAMLNYFSTTAAQYQMSLEDYISATGSKSREEFLEKSMEDIKAVAKEALIIQAVMETENMSTTDEDIKKYAQVDDIAELEKVYGKPYLSNVVMQNLVVELINTTAVDET